MVVGESKRTATANIMDGIENTGDVRMHDHRLRLKQRFDIVRKLGQGTYGKVQLGINKKTGQEVAIKTIKKCKIESEADLIRIRREVQIMSSVRHPNIVHIYEVFENSEKMILVMEYCPGGELYDYLSQKKVLQEEEARRLFRQIATATYYCHIHKICHRDLKLENVLLDDTGSAKIADFGLSNVFKETSLLSTFCGSPLYASPEIVKGTPYIGPEVDCWSLGVLLYTLVYGAMPFDGSNFKRLVRQISNGDYYEPKNPSTASPLIRDMLTVDPLKRADIAYICDHPWVNCGYEASCLEVAEALAAETPVRLDLLLSLAPAAPSNSNSVMVPPENDLGPEESGTDLTSSTSMAVEPSNSAEKRILDLVAEGGEDAIKPSPTRTIVSAGENKRKLELAMSASGLQRKKERVASMASLASQAPPLPEETGLESPPAEEPSSGDMPQPCLKSSATITIAPAAATIELARDATKEIVKDKEDEPKEKTGAKPRVVLKKKTSPTKVLEEKPAEKQVEPKQEETKPSAVSSAAEKLTSLSIAPSSPETKTPAKPKKLSMPGGNVGSFKDQFERRASLTAAPEIKRNVSKPVVSKIAKPKSQSEDRELSTKQDNGTVRLQQIGIEPSPTPQIESEPHRGGVKKTESEPNHGATPVDPSVLLQDARRSLQNSMAKLVEEKAGEDSRRRTARDIISSAIRTGKPPVPYGRSSSAGVASLVSPPGTPPAQSSRVFRTEAQHRVEDHRNANSRGVSVERIIPISMAGEDSPTSPLQPQTPQTPQTPQSPQMPQTPLQKPSPAPAPRTPLTTPLRRLVSTESGSASESCSSPGGGGGEPIKKSAREFIIPIAVEGKGYVTPRQRSLEPESPAPHRLQRPIRHRRISSLVSGGESEEEDDNHMHRLRPSRLARADSASSGEEDEEDEGFHLLTAENLFSTLLHRVRALTNRLNGEEGPGFPQHTHSLFNNLQSPFFTNSPHLPRRNLLREGWGSRDLHADFDSMFNKSRQAMPRGSSSRSGRDRADGRAKEDTALDLSDLDLASIEFSEREMRALSGLTPALSRRLQRQLLASLPPRAARTLRRTLSLHAAAAEPASASASAAAPRAPRSHSASKSRETDHDRETEPATNQSHECCTPTPDAAQEPIPEISPSPSSAPQEPIARSPPSAPPSPSIPEKPEELPERSDPLHFSTLPRLRRRSRSRDPETPTEAEGSSATLGRRGSSERPRLSKYLTPERALSLDEPYPPDTDSLLAEPSYIAAYGGSGGASCGALRRHSLRLAGETPRKRVSRFLRSDFFDRPTANEESIYAKHKKEKELETQRILREIREKRGRAEAGRTLDTPPPDDSIRKCSSPLGTLLGKERSRSNTPFFPSLDNIKETAIDASARVSRYESDAKQRARSEDIESRDSKLIRPKSYPVKTLDSIDEPSESSLPETSAAKEAENKEKRESRLMRPKSYPTSSPSPEKVYISRTIKKDDSKDIAPKNETLIPEVQTDVEVSFSITLPKKKADVAPKTDALKNKEIQEQNDTKVDCDRKSTSTLVLKKYQIVSSLDKSDQSEHKAKNGTAITNGAIPEDGKTTFCENSKSKVSKKDEIKKTIDSEQNSNEKKGTIKKKIIRKVSSKSKTDLASGQDTGDVKTTKKVTKKVKEKSTDDDNSKSATVTKKKSVLQSIGHKLEKFASSKSSSPEKVAENLVDSDTKKSTSKLRRTQREQSVPVNVEPPSESNLIKRAVTVTDVVALENQTTNNNKTTVSKVLGLFKKFEPKDKIKPILEKSLSVDTADMSIRSEPGIEPNIDNSDKDKPRRPTSLLLNGLGRKNKYSRTSSDSVSILPAENDDQPTIKKENDTKNKNSLKLDFSKLPRVKKIVPTNPVIEPQLNYSSLEGETEKKYISEKIALALENSNNIDHANAQSRSRSRSRSTISNSELKSDLSADTKYLDRTPISPSENSTSHPLRNHESTSPEKEDIVDRIRRKSFYSRFNEKKQRRKSTLVGPGATEYDPLARIHAPPSEHKYDLSPTSPAAYDLSPGLSATSDLSPSTERYRTLLSELPRTNLKYENYGLNDKIDTYRSLDRNDFRKYPGTRSYIDYDQPALYGTQRYSRTKSLLDSSDGTDSSLMHSLRDPLKYNRTISMYSPGNYATYRPKRTHNPAIILKESEKEPSPENILDKIRQRKNFSISVTRKPDRDTESVSRSPVPSQGEGDGAECPEKVD